MNGGIGLAESSIIDVHTSNDSLEHFLKEPFHPTAIIINLKDVLSSTNSHKAAESASGLFPSRGFTSQASFRLL